MLVVSNALTIGGLALLAVAITCTVFVITDFLFRRAWAAAFTAVVALASSRSGTASRCVPRMSPENR
jgi:hypothetical protein